LGKGKKKIRVRITDLATFDVAACGSAAQWVKPLLRVCRGRRIKNSAHWYDEWLDLQTASQYSKAPSVRGGTAGSDGTRSSEPRAVERDVLGQCDDGAGGWEQWETKCLGELPQRPARCIRAGHAYPSSRAMTFVNLL